MGDVSRQDAKPATRRTAWHLSMGGRLLARRRVTRMLEQIEVPYPWNIHDLVEWTAERRGRKITLKPVLSPQLPAIGVSGVWVTLPQDDLIMFSAATTDYHRQHIICHELAHMLLKHNNPGSGLAEDASALLRAFPDVWPEALTSVLCRDQFSRELEYEAELLATRIMAMANRAPACSRSSASGNLEYVLRGF